MANKLKSVWTVTFDLGGPNERVLVVPGQFIEDELEVGGAQVTEDGDYIEADDSEPLAYGRTKRTLKLTVHHTHADAAAAREHALEVDRTIPVNVTADLTVAITGGDTYVYQHAAFQSWSTVPRRIGGFETATTYEIKCGALSLGAPAPPPGPEITGLAESDLWLTRAAGMLDPGGAAVEHLDALATWQNSGTGGDAVQATAGARPTTLLGTGVYFPGVAGNRVWVNHAAAQVAGANFSLRWDGVLPSYRPAARVCLISKWDAPGNGRSFALYLEPNGKVTLAVSTNGTAAGVTEWTSAVPLDVPGNQFVGIQVIKNFTNLSFMLYPSIAWTGGVAFSPTQTISNLTAANYAVPFEVGSTSAGTADLMQGFLHRAQIRTDGITNADNPAAMLDFINFAGLVFFDSAAAGTNPLTAGFNGAARARFDGSDDHLALATPVPLNGIDGVTVALIVRLNQLTGTRDLLVCADAAGTAPRLMIRLVGSVIELHARRLDADAVTVVSYTGTFALTAGVIISASIDYQAGTATLYFNSAPVAVGTLASTGPSAATNSAATRIGSGLAGANPSAMDVDRVLIQEGATNVWQHTALLAELNS